MSNYKKFTLKDVAAKLKNGEYAGLTGANRSIGKAQDMSEADKAKARAMAAKHFGASPAATAAPKKKKAGKKAAAKAVKAKPAAKKVAKAARGKKAKKSAKKAGRASAEVAAPQSEASPTPKAGPEKKPRRIPRTPSNGGKVQTAGGSAKPTESSRVSAVAATMGSVIGTVEQALKSMDFAKKICPKEDMAAGVAAAVNTMSRAVRALDSEVVTPFLSDSDSAPPVSRTPSNKGAAQKSAAAPKGKKGSKAKAAHKNGKSNLTPEEQEQLQHLKETQPAALAAAGLREVPKELVGEANGTAD